VSAFNSFKNLVDQDEQRRNQERLDRQERIKRVLNRQSVVTVDNQQQSFAVHESEMDKRIREHNERLAFEERLKQEKKKEEMRRIQEDIKHKLDIQV
jgi:hypothetical protein